MAIFSVDSGKLKEIAEIPFKLEKDIQDTVEKNLDEIFGLDFVTSEFQLTGLRIDTLGFDRESGSFVIIEYKRDKSFSVIDQGFAYLSLMLNSKADFILVHNENSNKVLRKDDVDWSQSKVIFMAHSFTSYQKQAIGFRDLPIELWEVKQYPNKTILFNKVETQSKSESITKLSSKSDIVSSVSREIKTYSEEYHYEKHGTQKTRELYEEIRDRIISFGDDIEPVYRKKYIAFKTKSNFVYINMKRSVLHVDISLPTRDLQDPKKTVRNMEGIGHHGHGYSRFTVNDKSQIPYLLGLIEQSYSQSKNK